MYFLHQIKRTNEVYDKGIVVKENQDGAEQSYYAYLGAYGFGHDANTDFVSAMITNDSGAVIMNRTWQATESEE